MNDTYDGYCPICSAQIEAEFYSDALQTIACRNCKWTYELHIVDRQTNVSPTIPRKKG